MFLRGCVRFTCIKSAKSLCLPSWGPSYTFLSVLLLTSQSHFQYYTLFNLKFMLILFVCLYLSLSETRLLQSIKVTIIRVPRFLEYLDLLKKWICSSVIWSLCECLPAEVLTGTFLVCSKGPPSRFHPFYHTIHMDKIISDYFLEICWKAMDLGNLFLSISCLH